MVLIKHRGEGFPSLPEVDTQGNVVLRQKTAFGSSEITWPPEMASVLGARLSQAALLACGVKKALAEAAAKGTSPEDDGQAGSDSARPDGDPAA